MSLRRRSMKGIYVFMLGLLAAWISGALLQGCSHSADRDQRTLPDNTTTEVEGPVATDEPRRASTELSTTSATEMKAAATFEETADGVSVVLNVEHAKPGKQAVHVHELGDCSDIAGKSMGEHFAPDHKEHGLPDESEHHLGDLGNITIAKDGKGSLDITAPGANLKDGDPQSFVGRAIIVHAKKDDGGQPTGNAGGRIGCAEIK